MSQTRKNSHHHAAVAQQAERREVAGVGHGRRCTFDSCPVALNVIIDAAHSGRRRGVKKTKMRRTIEIESSAFSPRARWLYGAEYYVEDAIIEYPAHLDHLNDDELAELADNEQRGVRYVDEQAVTA